MTPSKITDGSFYDNSDMDYKPRSRKGLLLAAASSLIFSVSTLLAKFLTELHPIQLSCLTSLSIVIFSVPVAVCSHHELFPREHRWNLIFRSVCGTVSLMSSFYAVQLMPLGDASVLFYTSPVFTLLFAKWFLKEPCTLMSFVVSTAIMLGVVLVTKPLVLFAGSLEISQEYYLGVVAAIVMSITEALGSITLRNLRKVNFSVILLNHGVLSLLQGSFASLFISDWSGVKTENGLLCFLLALFTCAEQILITLALSFELAGPVALIQASDIIYGYIFQVMFFSEEVDATSLIGACIVTVMVVYLARRTAF